MILLSIIVPISRLAGELENLRTWLGNSSNSEVEIVLVHDIQDANTSSELQEIITSIQNSNISLIDGTYGAPGLARNAGIQAAKGKWMIFWDGDDIGEVEEVLIELHSDENKEFDAIVFQYDLRVLNVKNRKYEEFNKMPSNDISSVAVNPGLWRICFKREIVGSSEFPSFLMAEDQMFLVKIKFSNLRVKISNRVVYHYYVGRVGQLTQNSKAIQDLQKTLKILRSEFPGSGSLFLCILLIRQSITALKRGSLALKFLGFTVLLWLAMRHPKLSIESIQKIRLFK